MKPLGEVFTLMQKLENRYEGSFSIKDSERRYLLVNDEWLSSKKLSKHDVIGKTDEEIFSRENAMEAIIADIEVLKKTTPVESAFSVIINGERISYFTIKWVVRSESSIFLCTLGDIAQNKERVLKFRNNIDDLYMRELIN